MVLLLKELKQAAADAGEAEMVATVNEAPKKGNKAKATQKRFIRRTSSLFTADKISKEVTRRCHQSVENSNYRTSKSGLWD
jgi:hypothetical protein